MKVLIWIACSAAATIVNMLFLDAGIRLGGIPYALLFVGAMLLAVKLCRILDWSRAKKKAAEAGMTISEYGRHGLPEKFLAQLEEMCNTVPYEQVKSQLKACVKKKKITREQYIILLKEFSTTK